MWFKQLQVFELPKSFHVSLETFTEQLQTFAFTSCFPTMPFSIGWTSPVDEENAPLARALNGYRMICLLVEEKILPTTVIQQELAEKIKEMETTQNRKIYQKEKLTLKDEIILTLLPRAFSKFTRVYAFIDTNNHWLFLGTTNAKKTEQFITLFKKSINEEIKAIDLKKLSPAMTHLLKEQQYPKNFSIEKSCVLQDPNQQKRIIRCQQQDLSAVSIQSLIHDGCEAKQLAFSWQDQVNFVIADDFSLRTIQYQDELLAHSKEMEAETKQQYFDADFFIMAETLSRLLTDLVDLFSQRIHKSETQLQMVG